MKIFLNATDIQRLEQLIDSPERRALYLETKFIETRQNFWLSIGQGIKQIQDDCEAGRA